MAVETDPAPVLTTPPRRRLIRAPREFGAGLCLVGLAIFALYAGRELETGQLSSVGPGLLPRVAIALLGVFGVGFVIVGLVKDGEALERWTLRAPLLITLGVVGFALTIREYGLAVAGPLVVVVGGASTPEVRAKELVLFAIVGTGLCILLFRYLLGLPLPVLSVGSFYL